MFDTVLVGYEGSSQSEDALALGQALMRPGGRLIAACQFWYEPMAARVSKSGPGPAALRAGADEVLAPLRERGGIELEPAPGTSPAHALHDLAERERADLIVVGSPRGRVRRATIGGTAERLLHGAPCAIAVAPDGYRESPGALARIGVAYTDAPEADAALEAARVLAAESGQTPVVVTALDTPSPNSLGLTVPQHQRWLQELRAAETGELEERLSPAENELREVVDGNPVEELLARAAGLDLLVMGSRGYGPVRRVILGSVAHGLLSKGCPCPLLVTPRGSAEVTPTRDPTLATTGG